MEDEELRRRLKEADRFSNNDFPILGENIIMNAIENDMPKTNTTKNKFYPILAVASTLAVVGGIGVGLNTTSGTNSEILITLSSEERSVGSDLALGVPNSEASTDAMWYQPFNFIYIPSDSLSREEGYATAYRIVLPSNPQNYIKTVAKIFGIEGEVQTDPYGYDKNFYAIGDWQNYSNPSVTYSNYGGGNWNYSNPVAYQNIDQYPEECYIREEVRPDSEPRDTAGSTSGSTGSGSTGSGSAASDPSIEPGYPEDDIKIIEPDFDIPEYCYDWQPKPPEGLPSKETAIMKANDLLKSIYGETFPLQAYADYYSISVYGSKEIEGSNTSLAFGVYWYGPDISYAYGYSGSIEKIDNVKIVSEYDALSRSTDNRWLSYYYDYLAYPQMLETNVGSSSSQGGGTIGVDSSEATISVDAPVQDDGLNSDEIVREPIPTDIEDYPEPEDKIVKAIAAELKLLTAYGPNGELWLLPGYVYEFEESSDYYLPRIAIIAVDESILKFE